MMCVVLFATQGFAQSSKYRGERGVTSIGLLGGYAIDYKSIVIGADYRYNILDRVRIAPSFLHVFEQDHRSAWYINADVHYLVRITEELTLYPLAGFGVSIHKYNTMHVDKTNTRLGPNIGFGCEFRMTEDLIIGGEFKYNLTTDRDFDQNFLIGRVAYYF